MTTNKEHADVLRGLVTETMPCAITALQAAIALLDPEPVVGETRDPHPIGGNAAVPVLGPRPAGDATERERCVHFALEITRIEQHHGLAEIADMIQRAREELQAENARLQDSAAAGWAIAKARVEVVNALQAKHTALVKAARDYVEGRELLQPLRDALGGGS